MNEDAGKLIAGLRSLARHCDDAGNRSLGRGDEKMAAWWDGRSNDLERSSAEVAREFAVLRADEALEPPFDGFELWRIEDDGYAFWYVANEGASVADVRAIHLEEWHDGSTEYVVLDELEARRVTVSEADDTIHEDGAPVRRLREEARLQVAGGRPTIRQVASTCGD